MVANDLIRLLSGDLNIGVIKKKNSTLTGISASGRWRQIEDGLFNEDESPLKIYFFFC